MENNNTDNNPKITINGKVLNDVQTMLISIAISSLYVDMKSNGQWNNEHGKTMTKLYLKKIREIKNMGV